MIVILSKQQRCIVSTVYHSSTVRMPLDMSRVLILSLLICFYYSAMLTKCAINDLLCTYYVNSDHLSVQIDNSLASYVI